MVPPTFGATQGPPGHHPTGASMGKRILEGWPRRAALVLMASAAAVATLVPTAIAQPSPARFARPAQSVRRTTVPHPAALPGRSPHWTYARQVLLALHPGAEPTE